MDYPGFPWCSWHRTSSCRYLLLELLSALCVGSRVLLGFFVLLRVPQLRVLQGETEARRRHWQVRHGTRHDQEYTHIRIYNLLFVRRHWCSCKRVKGRETRCKSSPDNILHVDIAIWNWPTTANHTNTCPHQTALTTSLHW